MPTYEQLYHLNLANLKTAADRWTETSTKFKGLHTSFGDQVERPYKDAGWRQPVLTAAYAGTKTTEAKQEFEDARIEAEGIAKILDDLHTKLKGYKADLRHCAEVKAKKKGLHVSAKGEVTARDDLSDDPMRHHDPDYQGLIRRQKADIDGIVAELEGILQKAAEADEEACYALNKNLGGDNANFNDKVYTSLNEADATRDSARALELAGRGKDMSDQELSELNGLLKEHSKDKDSKFEEKFATGLRPKGTLAFWSQIADPYPVAYGRSEEREKPLKDLQKQLGTTLGTATHSDTEAMTKWKQEMIKIGPQRLEIDDAGHPYGFQVMSNLMRHGEYDREFLLDYGHALVGHERKIGGGADLDMMWTGNANMGDLNFGADNDRGNDPMTGYLEALGHNPEASADFFKEKENFDYLVGGSEDTKARDWPADALMGDDNGNVAGHDSLGHALESATIGRPYGADVPPLNRDADGAAVMQRLVTTYGDHPELMHERPGIEDSISKAGAAYIDDLNNGVSDFGDRNGDKRDPLYDTKGQEHAKIPRGDALDFLTVMGQNEDTHAAISQAQQAYTLGVLDSTRNTTEAEAVVRTGAQVHGVLDDSRVKQIESDYLGDETKAKEELGKSTEWIKWGTGAVIGGAVGVATGGMGAAIAVPLAAETVGGALETFVGQQIDDTAEKFKANHDDTLNQAQDEYTRTGESRAALPVTAYMTAHGIEEFSTPHRVLTAAAAAGYGQGKSSRTPYKEED
ncbi:hypothetical protein [Streptomyces sp. AS02]|uniref:hypothetical protein n=1 Tax=Streptomyces sp. AS02 TaxID=2938946 RepID=UPI0020214621|nr:hypothetical protein [Streptomyces sp. AS02]MCL8016801.1 hypothetical protein [Streptomyces sp. AS02]